MPRPVWSRPLAHPVAFENRDRTRTRSVRTLAEAARLALENKKTGERRTWQALAEKLMTAAESGSATDVLAATRQLELALLLDGNDDMRLAMTGHGNRG